MHHGIPPVSPQPAPRRRLLQLGLATGLAGLFSRAALAHHGWSSFDTEAPLYLEGTAREVRWRNPHAELVLEVADGLVLPADLARRQAPAQSAGIDGAAILGKTRLPKQPARRWAIELAPLTRMQAWKVSPVQDGQRIAVVGYTFAGEQGEPVLRVEYLFVGGQAYGLRSSPA